MARHVTVTRRAAGQFLAAVAILLGLAVASVICSGQAWASPGQCMSGSGGFGGGGFCDSAPQSDGSFYHCESVYVFGIGGRNCFWVRPVPVEVDPRGWVPA